MGQSDKPGSLDKPANKLGMVGSLQELRKEGYVPFTHAFLYVYGDIEFDIIARFNAETMEPVELTYFDFSDNAIIDLPKPYTNRLFAMNDTSYARFVTWLQSVEVINREKRSYYRPSRLSAPLLDPFMRELKIEQPRPELIDVWTMSSMAGRIVPKGHVETLSYPIFKPGEAEELLEQSRMAFLARLPRPTTAWDRVYLQKNVADPAIIIRGRELLSAGS